MATDRLKEIAVLRERIAASPSVSSPVSSPSNRQAFAEAPVILDIGCRGIRAGLAGGRTPICDVAVLNDRETFWPLDRRRGDEQMTNDLLQATLTEIYYRYLLIDGRSRKVVVLERPGLADWIKNSINFTLFNSLQSISVTFVLAPVCATIAAGTSSALVVDIGWHETTITPIYDYKPIIGGICSTTRAASELHSLVSDALFDSTGVRPSFSEIEDFIARAVYLPRNPSPPSSIISAFAVSLNGSLYYVPSRPTRSTPVRDCFFQSSTTGDDIEHQTLHSLIISSLQKLNNDARALLQHRIIFAGACSSIPGLKLSLMEEVQRAFPDARAIVSLGAWSGASLYLSREREYFFSLRGAGRRSGSTSSTSFRIPGEIDREKFLIEKQCDLYDWRTASQ
ncbi:uncharacterized protein V2V93DRAFT_389169 [Kockiozyma suomiensis]|uniref:uncharacterized protein n=1 Tax=Kockiozyma suomiensis TaxID=1337062 RepID=UPI003343557A